MILTERRKVDQNIYCTQTVRRHKVSRKKSHKNTSGKLQLFGIILGVLVVIMLAFGLVFMKSQITKLNIEINEINCSLHDAEAENTYLLAEKNSALDLEYIENEAVALGLNYPSEDSIVKIAVNDAGEDSVSIRLN